MPQEPGVYFFLDENDKVLYIGKAKNLKNRVSSYFGSQKLGEKTALLVSQINKIKYIITNSDVESLLLEANLIKKHQPFYNIALLDDKSYPFIQITAADIYPKIFLTRKKEDKKALYFGPYPHIKEVKIVLMYLRKIFPYQGGVKHPKGRCFYYHLGLCPCPETTFTKVTKKEYRKNISRIIKFLRGGGGELIKELEEERSRLAASFDYEKALQTQKKIGAIKNIAETHFSPFDYEINPNLRQDTINEGMTDLKQKLRQKGIAVGDLERIECFDVSNIGGQQAAGSMVVFINGRKESRFYRRFKIRGNHKKPNDVAQMQEIIARRLRHPEWTLPGLLVVDGGKNQISAARKALIGARLNIPVIGLTKKEETIITENFQRIVLKIGTPSLSLVMKIRDEAHRFAHLYHRKLRIKKLFAGQSVNEGKV